LTGPIFCTQQQKSAKAKNPSNTEYSLLLIPVYERKRLYNVGAEGNRKNHHYELRQSGTENEEIASRKHSGYSRKQVVQNLTMQGVISATPQSPETKCPDHDDRDNRQSCHQTDSNKVDSETRSEPIRSHKGFVDVARLCACVTAVNRQFHSRSRSMSEMAICVRRAKPA
jgi:hypothetical protein